MWRLVGDSPPRNCPIWCLCKLVIFNWVVVENFQRWEHLKKPEEIIGDLDACSFNSGIFDIIRRVWLVYRSTKKLSLLCPPQLPPPDLVCHGKIPDRPRVAGSECMGSRSFQAGDHQMRKIVQENVKVRKDQIAQVKHWLDMQSSQVCSG